MTLREVLHAFVSSMCNLDKEIKVRIYVRDADGCVIACKMLPISSIGGVDHPIINIEQSVIDKTLSERL